MLLDPRTGRPECDKQPFDPDALTACSNIPTEREFDAMGRVPGMTRRPVPVSERDRALLGRLPKSIRRSLELAAAESLSKTGRGPVGGNTQAWAGILNPSDIVVADQTAVVGTTEGLLFPYHFGLMPAGWWAVGSIIRFYCAGKITSAASSPGNLTLTLRWGTTSAGTSLGASAALALQVSQTNITWVYEGFVVCRATGSGTVGQLIVIGVFSAGTGTTLFTTGPQATMPASAAAAVGIDTTLANALLLDATLGSASDSMTAQIVAPLALN